MSHMQSSSFFKRGRIAGGLGFIVVASAVALLLLSGAALAGIRWTANGVAVTTGGSATQPSVISDGSGGAIVAWVGGTNLYAQRLNSSGAAQWTAGGVVVNNAGSPSMFTMATDNANGAILTWISNFGGGWHVYAQRVDSGGNVMWATTGGRPGVAICEAAGGAPSQSMPNICEDGYGGAYIAWQDQRTGSGHDRIYAQRVNSVGTVQWTGDGVPVCTEHDTLQGALVINPGIVTWVDHYTGAPFYPKVRAQKLDPTTGATLWTAATTSVAVSTVDGKQSEPAITTDGSGGAIIA